MVVAVAALAVDGRGRGDHAARREAGGGESLVIERGVFLAAVGPAVEVFQLDVEDGRLQGVQAEVAADELVEVGRSRAVDAQELQPVVEGGVVGQDHAGVAEGAQVLGGEEGEAAHVADRAAAAALVLGADGLGAILDDRDMAAPGDLHDGIHVGHLAEEVNGQDGLGARCDGRLDFMRVDVEGQGVDVDENGLGVEAVDDAGRGEEREGRGDDFVAGADVQGHEGDEQSVRAGGDADGMGGAGIGGHGLLEFLDFGAHDEILGVADVVDDGPDLVADGPVLGFEIEQRNIHDGGNSSYDRMGYR